MPKNDIPWLEEFLSEAKEKRWCINPWCTTCGSLKFRNELITRAAGQAGGLQQVRDVRRRGPLAKNLDSEDLERCCTTILDGMANLPEPGHGDFDLAAVNFLLDELQRMMWPFLGVIESAITGTWVGDRFHELQEESALRKKWAEDHARREREDRRRAAKRREKRKKERAAAAAARACHKVKRDQRRCAFLDKLANLSPIELLESLLDEDLEFPLEAIPAKLVPIEEKVISQIESSTREALLEKIDRRPGVWADLKRRLITSDRASEGGAS